MTDPIVSDPTANAMHRLLSAESAAQEEVARLRRELAVAEESIQVLGMLLTEAKMRAERAEAQVKLLAGEAAVNLVAATESDQLAKRARAECTELAAKCAELEWQRSEHRCKCSEVPS